MLKKSFSLIEVILSVAIFSLLAGSFIFLIIEAYKINERSRDLSLATILAEEGAEAVRSIRDSNFRDLIEPSQGKSYCLEIENNRWVLNRLSSREDCIEEIGKFSRQVFITGRGNRERDITILVSWQPITGSRRDVRLFSRLTNWR